MPKAILYLVLHRVKQMLRKKYLAGFKIIMKEDDEDRSSLEP
jgi:hypothetical protein